MDQPKTKPEPNCCDHLFFAHYVAGKPPFVVLECCTCEQLWYRRDDGKLVRCAQQLVEAIRRKK